MYMRRSACTSQAAKCLCHSLSGKQVSVIAKQAMLEMQCFISLILSLHVPGRTHRRQTYSNYCFHDVNTVHEPLYNWALTRKNLTFLHVKIICADQHTHQHNLINAFIVRSLESIMPQLTCTRNISIFKLVSVA